MRMHPWPQAIATWNHNDDTYEVRLNLRRTLVFVTDQSGASRAFSPEAALDPTTEVRIGVTIPDTVREAIAHGLTTTATPTAEEPTS